MDKVKNRRLCVLRDRQSPTVLNFSTVPNKVCPSDSVNSLNRQAYQISSLKKLLYPRREK